MKWVYKTPEGRIALKSVRVDRNDKDIVCTCNGLILAKFTASGDIVVDSEAITKAKAQN